ncbi:unnamed protein product [Lactuca saligna]|uniref:Uncharacterized protein n=1 Tax=Lactuca saligna TaxID=75948 RepID=A0AA36A0P5_LACSI|nr:unnamed protein product [Lactuca saligna]
MMIGLTIPLFPSESGVDQLVRSTLLSSNTKQSTQAYITPKQLKFRRLLKVLWWLSLVMILVDTPSWIMKHGFGSVLIQRSFWKEHPKRLEYLTGYDLVVVMSKEFATAFPVHTFISPVVDLLIKNGRNGKNNGKVCV